jgi:His/Glu/Gln/Arg/opine family amino acid ABC transporter permease subunit
MDLARAKPSSWLSDERKRGLIYQILVLGCIAALAWGAIYNAVVNMRARGIPTGFGFWNDVAGFDINLHLINYSNLSTYGQAFWVGLLNTLLIAVICIPLATLLGFAVGVARLSHNWLLSKVALVYTSIMRNTPLLLLLLFWYNAVLKSSPPPRQSISVGGVVFLNNRGLFADARRAGVGLVVYGRSPDSYRRCARISDVGAVATEPDWRAGADCARGRRAHPWTACARDSGGGGAVRIRYRTAFRLQS